MIPSQKVGRKNENEQNKEFLEGFKMIYKKLTEILDNKNVKVIDENNIEYLI